MMKRCAWPGYGLLAFVVLAGQVSAQGFSYPASPPPGPVGNPGCQPPAPYPSMGARPGIPSTTPGTPSTTPGTGSGSQPPSTTQTDTNGQANAGPTGTEGAGAGQQGGNEGGRSIGGGSYAQVSMAPTGVGLASVTGATQGSTTGSSSTGIPGVSMTTHTPNGNLIFTSTTHTPTPLILPGLFTAMSAEPAQPMDRIFLGYGYFDGFQVTNGAGGLTRGFNLNTFDVGAEKTLLDGQASIYVRVPFLLATDNITGQALDGLGDVSAGLKVALWRNLETGSTLSAGMTVSAPTSRDLVVTTTTSTAATGKTSSLKPTGLNVFQLKSTTVGGTFVPAPSETSVPAPQTQTINPTFLQPWAGGLLVMDRLFVQEYLAVIIPTDSTESTFINNDVGIGYQLWRSDCPDRWLTSLTPVVDLQLLLPINHQGTPSQATTPSAVTSASTGGNGLPASSALSSVPTAPTVLNSSYQAFLTAGMQFGLGNSALLSVGVVTPIVGPKAYTVGGTVGLNLFF